MSDREGGSTSDREGGSMSDDAGRNAPKKRVLRSVAAQAAVLSAAAHFLWAWPRLGELGDPRPAVFLLGGAFTVAIGVATLHVGEYRRLYALGAGTLLAFLVGYVDWHGAGVTAALVADPLAIVAAAAEAVGTVAFLALYWLAPPTSVVVERRRDTEGRATENGDTESGDPKNGGAES